MTVRVKVKRSLDVRVRVRFALLTREHSGDRTRVTVIVTSRR